MCDSALTVRCFRAVVVVLVVGLSSQYVMGNITCTAVVLVTNLYMLVNVAALTVLNVLSLLIGLLLFVVTFVFMSASWEPSLSPQGYGIAPPCFDNFTAWLYFIVAITLALGPTQTVTCYYRLTRPLTYQVLQLLPLANKETKPATSAPVREQQAGKQRDSDGTQRGQGPSQQQQQQQLQARKLREQLLQQQNSVMSVQSVTEAAAPDRGLGRPHAAAVGEVEGEGPVGGWTAKAEAAADAGVEQAGSGGEAAVDVASPSFCPSPPPAAAASPSLSPPLLSSPLSSTAVASLLPHSTFASSSSPTAAVVNGGHVAPRPVRLIELEPIVVTASPARRIGRRHNRAATDHATHAEQPQ